MLQLIKYPSIRRLAWSPDSRGSSALGVAKRDETYKEFISEHRNEEYVATVKFDGGNIFMSNSHMHARSLSDNCDHVVYNYTKRTWAQIKHRIPDDIGIFGEDLHVTRSIKYENLPAFFMAFTFIQIINGVTTVMSTIQQKEWAEIIGLAHVPVIWAGVVGDDLEHQLCHSNNGMFNGDQMEGYVLRPASSFRINDLPTVAAKFVRPNHVQSDRHWIKPPYQFNKLSLDKIPHAIKKSFE